MGQCWVQRCGGTRAALCRLSTRLLWHWGPRLLTCSLDPPPTLPHTPSARIKLMVSLSSVSLCPQTPATRCWTCRPPARTAAACTHLQWSGHGIPSRVSGNLGCLLLVLVVVVGRDAVGRLGGHRCAPQGQLVVTPAHNSGAPATAWTACPVSQLRASHPPTVFIDGKAIKQVVSLAANPAAGWYTSGAAAGAGASVQAPFDAPFYLALNLAVGGTWPGAPDATTPFPATLSVEHVRVWATPDYALGAASLDPTAAVPEQAAPAQDGQPAA